MNGTAELLQLAHLLRLGANTARDIATIRERNATEIYSLADEAELMASKIERIAQTTVRDNAARIVRH